MEFYINRYKNIEKKEYELEVITPMFIAGANKNTSELRTASIKGMLRFWWRALNPQLVKVDKYEKPDYNFLKEEESKLFGDSGRIYGKSLTKIFLKYNDIKNITYKPTTKNFPFEGINIGEKFLVSLFAPKSIFTIIDSLFQFCSIVGGLGKRSRRGFGCFQILKQKSKDIVGLFKLINYINNSQIYSLNQNNIIILSQNFSCNYPFIQKIEIGRPSKSWESIIKKIKYSAHKNNSYFTGFVSNKKRFASPIYVSVFRNEDNYYPIVTSLKIFSPITIKGKNTIYYFKKDIL